MLADSLSDYAVKLLDKVRTGQELSDLLDDEEGELTRLRLAIKYEEKKFVAHPSCQKKLLTVWFGDMPMQQHCKKNWQLALFSVLLTVAYPFLAISYWVYPWNKVSLPSYSRASYSAHILIPPIMICQHIISLL